MGAGGRNLFYDHQSGKSTGLGLALVNEIAGQYSMQVNYT